MSNASLSLPIACLRACAPFSRSSAFRRRPERSTAPGRRSTAGGVVALLLALHISTGPAAGVEMHARTVSPSADPDSVSIFDVFTSGTAGGRAAAVQADRPGGEASRELSAEGAHVLLNDARQLLGEQERGRGREILRDVLARRPMDDPSAQAAALLLAQTAETAAVAEPYLRLLHLAGPNAALAAEGARTALRWAEQAASQPPPGAAEPPALPLIELAEQHAIRSEQPGLVEEAILARARLCLSLQNPQAAWEAMASAERAGLVGNPAAKWLAFRGDAALATRNPDDAREAYARLAQQFSDSPEAERRANRLGLLCELAGEREAARRAYRLGRPSLSTPKTPHWVETRLQALQHPYFPPQGNREKNPTR